MSKSYIMTGSTQGYTAEQREEMDRNLQRAHDTIHGITPEKRKQIDHDVGVAQFFFGLFCFLVFLAHIL